MYPTPLHPPQATGDGNGKDGPFYMLFLDWEKAFDKISHTGLHSALEAFGLDPMYLKLIDALYADPQFTVAAGGQQSTTRTAHTGIRQGCPLSPLLYILVHEVQLRMIRGARDVRSRRPRPSTSLSQLLPLSMPERWHPKAERQSLYQPLPSNPPLSA